MKEISAQVTYIRNGADPRSFVLEIDEPDAHWILERRMLEAVMKIESPDLLSIDPLIPNVPRGNPGTLVKTSAELMALHGISTLMYVIDGVAYQVST